MMSIEWSWTSTDTMYLVVLLGVIIATIIFRDKFNRQQRIEAFFAKKNENENKKEKKEDKKDTKKSSDAFYDSIKDALGLSSVNYQKDSEEVKAELSSLNKTLKDIGENVEKLVKPKDPPEYIKKMTDTITKTLNDIMSQVKTIAAKMK